MRAGVFHILVLGQSNVANYGKPPSASDFGRVFHRAEFHPLTDPLPGGGGEFGSVWSRFAPLARDRLGLADLVVSVLAQGGTEIADWAPGGQSFALYEAALPALLACPVPVSHVVFHQGEKDTLQKTARDSYIERFTRFHEAVRAGLPDAQWLVCTASYRMGVISEDVRAAQRIVSGSFGNCHAGPDTDALGAGHRYDNTHMNEAGLSAFAESLVQCFAAIGRKA